MKTMKMTRKDYKLIGDYLVDGLRDDTSLDHTANKMAYLHGYFDAVDNIMSAFVHDNHDFDSNKFLALFEKFKNE